MSFIDKADELLTNFLQKSFDEGFAFLIAPFFDSLYFFVDF